MSLENDITELQKIITKDDQGFIKRLDEAGEEMFKPASSKDVSARKEQFIELKNKELYDHAEKLYPGIVERIRGVMPNEAMVQTLIAYADGFGAKPYWEQVFPEIKYTGQYDDIRDLDWAGVYTDAATFIEQAKIIKGYNNFDVNAAKQIVKFLKGKEYRLGREGSVVVYVSPVSNEDLDLIMEEDEESKEQTSDVFGQDETDLEGEELRIWWD